MVGKPFVDLEELITTENHVHFSNENEFVTYRPNSRVDFIGLRRESE